MKPRAGEFWYQYYIVYDETGKIVGKFSFYDSLLKYLSENFDKVLTFKTLPECKCKNS